MLLFRSFKDYVGTLEKTYGEDIAFRWYNAKDKTIACRTFAEFVDAVRRAASFYERILDGAYGKHVAFLGENSFDYCVNFLGIMLAGGVAVNLNPRENEEILIYELDFSDVDYVVLDKKVWREEPEYLNKYEGRCASMTDYNGETITDIKEYPVDILAAMIFTSGTTGRHKCVALSAKNLIFNITPFLDGVGSVEDSVEKKIKTAMHIMPMHHIAGIDMFLGYIGGGIALHVCTDFRLLMRNLEILGADTTFAVPMVVEWWAQLLKEGQKDKLGGLISVGSGGAAMRPDVAQTFREYGIAISNSYAMSETTGAGCFNVVTLSDRNDSVGRSSKGVEIKIIEDEICFRSEAIMDYGYYKNQEETDKILIDGWLHSGDLGYIDEEGYVYITGRKKNLIILSSGENINPEELEILIGANDYVTEVIVKEKENQICAEIYSESGNTKEIEEHIENVNMELPMFKNITLIEFRKVPFEKTSSGKIKRN